MSLEVELVLGVLFGLAGWQYAIHLEHKYGVPAWGLPSWVWGLITGASLLLGAVLMAVAERMLAKEPEDAPLGLAAYAEHHAAAAELAAAVEGEAPAPAAVHDFPVQAVPAQEVPVLAAVAVPAVAPPAVPAPAPVPAAGPPAGWHPDPSGKYDHRWWDGRRWTAEVSTNGVAGKDV